MRRLLLVLVLITGCAGKTTDPAGNADGGDHDSGSVPMDAGKDTSVFTPPDSGPRPMVTVPAGDVSGEWCGDVTVEGDVTVPVGQTLDVCAGAIVKFAANARLSVNGTMNVHGDSTHEVVFYSEETWIGVRVAGTLAADFARIRDGSTCIQGVDGSTIRVDDSTIEECQVPFRVSNGGTFDRTQVIGGTSINVTGGVLHMTDSVVDGKRPETSPDCIIVDAGALDLEHVRVTGCHCPLHFNSGVGTSSVTYSIFDGAAVPLMIRQTTGDFRHNHFLGTTLDLQDIEGGGSFNTDIDVTDSYYGGGAPQVLTAQPSQFKGTSGYRTTPVPGVGPR